MIGPSTINVAVPVATATLSAARRVTFGKLAQELDCPKALASKVIVKVKAPPAAAVAKA